VPQGGWYRNKSRENSVYVDVSSPEYQPTNSVALARERTIPTERPPLVGEVSARHQNAGQNGDIKIANRSSENMSLIKYLGTAVTNQNLIQEEIKWRLNYGNASYHSVQNLVFSSAVKKRKKLKYTRL
jgi:hypothetical protein